MFMHGERESLFAVFCDVMAAFGCDCYCASCAVPCIQTTFTCTMILNRVDGIFLFIFHQEHTWEQLWEDFAVRHLEAKLEAHLKASRQQEEGRGEATDVVVY